MVHGVGSGKLSSPIGGRDHQWGPDTASVTLLEYGDYQCSYCRKAYPVVEEIINRLNKKLRFVYRHFPIAEIHPYAQNAAEAAEAANLQGKFWEMHAQLFTQPALDGDSLKKYAVGIGLDADRFGIDLDNHSQAGRVQEDLMSGLQSGVNGTPAFFINGIQFRGSWALENLLSAVQAKL